MNMDSKDKVVKLIGNVIENANIKNKEFAKKIVVIANKFYDNDISVEFSFHHGVLDQNEREDLMNEVWMTIYNYLNIPVFLVQVDDKGKMNENHDRQVSLIQNFLKDFEIEGICGFWVDDDRDDHDSIWVYIILDLDWLNDNQESTKPGFVANRMRNGVKGEIKKFLGIDVMVGSIAKRCEK